MARPRTRPTDPQELLEFKRAYARSCYRKYKLKDGYQHSTYTSEQMARKTIYMREHLANQRANNPEYVERKRAHDKRYRSTEAGRLTTHRSRAKRRAAGARHKISSTDWQRTMDAFAFLCAYCQIAKPTTKDHFIPLILGGCTVTGNLLPACARCNFSKNKKHPKDWCSPEQFSRVQNTLNSL